MAAKDPDCLVTVVVLCYNHADNLARCLDSVLAQKTDFAFRVVVIDDFSTDGSRDIIADYARRDARVVPVLHAENIYSQGRRSFAEYQENIKTPFFHVLESDDYWCDEGKLQLQVDALRAHPECIASAHAVEYRDSDGVLLETRGRRIGGKGRVYDLYTTRFCHLSSTLYRNFLDRIPAQDRTFLCRDIMRFYYALSMGKLHYVDRTMSVCRRTGRGVWTSLAEEARVLQLQELYFKLDRYLGFRFTKKFRHLYLPHEGKKLFSLALPYFWRGRKLLLSLAKA